ncbi:MAG TPA: lysylphosphatidylglycerol synthase transmembrane domain-containing protein [Vicinamibacterales bacterium]
MLGRVGTFALRATVTAGLLVLLAFVVADPGEMLQLLLRLSPVAALGTLLLTVGDRVLMALKWRLLLTARGVPLGVWTAIRAYFATSLAGLLLPVTVGADAVRIMVVRQYGVYDVAASIVVERTLGALAVLTVALASLAALQARAMDIPGGPAVAIIGLGAAVAAAFVVSLYGAAVLGRRLQGSKATKLLRLVEAYAAYRAHPGTLCVFYLLSIVECLFPVLITWIAAWGLGFDLPFLMFAISTPLALTVARLPVSLGGFGVQEASFVYAARLFGVGPTDALAIMLVMDAVLLIALLPAAFDSGMLSLGRSQPAAAAGSAAIARGPRDEL